MQLSLLDLTLTVIKLPAAQPVPPWALENGLPFVSITRTSEELSIVAPSAAIPSEETAPREDDWVALKVLGPLEFTLTGILLQLLEPLAAAEVSVFAVSTFDTDYVLVKQEAVETALTCLKQSGHTMV